MDNQTNSITSDRAWMTAAEASRDLNITRATLYAYVSRGLIESRAQPGSRKRLYAAADIQRLLSLRDPSPETADNRSALSFGQPVLDSAITLISDGRFFYRGRDATALAVGADLETVADILWMTAGTLKLPHANPPSAPASFSGAIESLVKAERTDTAAHGRTPQAVTAVAGRIVSNLTALWSTRPFDGLQPVHRALAASWGALPAADAIRTALVCCADHELNASTFAVRVAASTGASPYAALIAGLGTLSGPAHGGQTAKALELLRTARRTGDGRQTVIDRLRYGDPLPGFGHPLYPEGDPRARLILGALPHLPEPLTAAGDAGLEATGLHPNLDFGLAAIAVSHGLTEDQVSGLFAIGRSVGWLAHVAEQYEAGRLIRPRARYTGPDPRPDHTVLRPSF